MSSKADRAEEVIRVVTEPQEKKDVTKDKREGVKTVRFYRTTDVVRFGDGMIFLNESQISGRKRKLNVGENGKCKILEAIEFKAGEVIGLLEVPKMYTEILKPIEEKKVDAKS